jgi:DnaK suppressor protein
MNTFDENTLTRLRAGLLVREDELLGEISAARQADIAATNAIGIAATDVNDLKDQASNRERTTLQDAEVQRDRNELADVRAALARLNGGSYGICIDCEKPIDLLRLTAIPAAARCLACQTQFESRAV